MQHTKNKFAVKLLKTVISANILASIFLHMVERLIGAEFIDIV